MALAIGMFWIVWIFVGVTHLGATGPMIVVPPVKIAPLQFKPAMGNGVFAMIGPIIAVLAALASMQLTEEEEEEEEEQETTITTTLATTTASTAASTAGPTRITRGP